MDRAELKKQFQKAGKTARRIAVASFLEKNHTLRDYHFAYKLVYENGQMEEKPIQVAILSSFTFEQIQSVLSVESYCNGFPLAIYSGGFNQYEQEILNSQSELYRCTPQIIMLSVRIEELFPPFRAEFSSFSANELIHKQQKLIEKFNRLIQTIKENSTAQIIINNFTYPVFLSAGIYDHQHPDGQTAWIDSLNRKLAGLVQQHSDTFIFDFNYQLHLFGMQNAVDSKMWFTARIPYKTAFIMHLARQYAVYIKSMRGTRKKCLALDLDNTLWGGVIGEDGLNNIVIGQSYPGNVFREIQQTIRLYGGQGVILTLNSKNNLEEVKEVFDTHPDMVLKWEDFSAVRVNWQNKADNLRELAHELNIGLDSFVFVDDNPAEIEIIRQTFPQIETVSFGKNPLENLKKIRNLNSFQNLSFTESDRSKGKQYREQSQRRQLKLALTNLNDYFRSLEMKAQIKKGDLFALKRLVQLTQKTNQFNLTTRRYSENEMATFIKSKKHRVFYLRLKDRFGDNGITGLVIIKIEDGNWLIDIFLLSCRIIGRTAETALLAFVAERAKREHVKSLIGVYLPTPKNKLVKDFYKNHGFKATGTLWVLNVQQKTIPRPRWIEMEE